MTALFLLRLFHAILFLFALALRSRASRVPAVPIERGYGGRPHMEAGNASLEPFLAGRRKMRVPGQVVPVGGGFVATSEGKLLLLVDSLIVRIPIVFFDSACRHFAGFVVKCCDISRLGLKYARPSARGPPESLLIGYCCLPLCLPFSSALLLFCVGDWAGNRYG